MKLAVWGLTESIWCRLISLPISGASSAEHFSLPCGAAHGRVGVLRTTIPIRADWKRSAWSCAIRYWDRGSNWFDLWVKGLSITCESKVWASLVPLFAPLIAADSAGQMCLWSCFGQWYPQNPEVFVHDSMTILSNVLGVPERVLSSRSILQLWLWLLLRRPGYQRSVATCCPTCWSTGEELGVFIALRVPSFISH